MKIGPLVIGWEPLSTASAVHLGLEPCRQGWEAFVVMWNGNGFTVVCRPRVPRRREGG